MYEEKIIDSILHYRVSPISDWVKFTPEELTIKLMESRKAIRVDSVPQDIRPYFYRDTYPLPLTPIPDPNYYPVWEITC